MLEVSILGNPAASIGASVSGPAGEAALDYSNREADDPRLRGGSRAPLGIVSAVLAGIGLAGAILTVIATWSPVIKIQVLTVTPKTFSGYDRHSVALVVLGAFGALMVVGSVRGARPAMLALAASGLVVLLVALIQDLPHIHDTGVWNLANAYEDAEAAAGAGFWLETLGGVGMLLAGVCLLLLGVTGRPVRPSRHSRAS